MRVASSGLTRAWLDALATVMRIRSVSQRARAWPSPVPARSCPLPGVALCPSASAPQPSAPPPSAPPPSAPGPAPPERLRRSWSWLPRA
ncbi:hypothetical protein C7M71_025395 [Peterkaempfera bronchialis]|uniref:Uncharacterized protein n=1 Tax=Peterkaempfera bronchialis TaxID=2126346 RepID=A0A345T2N2_9ACTN|nr:hypothetical protein C7M71_025395 [Peterkaempfera bronchialis]